MSDMNVVRIKRGVTKPTINNLSSYELGYCIQGPDQGLYINNEGTIVKVTGEVEEILNTFISRVTQEIGFGNHVIEKRGSNITVFRSLGG